MTFHCSQATGVTGYFGGNGTTGGLFSTPGGVAVNDTSGNEWRLISKGQQLARSIIGVHDNRRAA
jgi:hypothetical protein